MKVPCSLQLLVMIAACATSVGQQVQVPAPARPGSPTKAAFLLDFDQALAKAKAEKRLLFMKPIYGGVDALGRRDYRCGSW